MNIWSASKQYVLTHKVGIINQGYRDENASIEVCIIYIFLPSILWYINIVFKYRRRSSMLCSRARYLISKSKIYEESIEGMCEMVRLGIQ